MLADEQKVVSSRRTNFGGALGAHDLDALDNGGARVVDAIDQRLRCAR